MKKCWRKRNNKNNVTILIDYSLYENEGEEKIPKKWQIIRNIRPATENKDPLFSVSTFYNNRYAVRVVVTASANPTEPNATSWAAAAIAVAVADEEADSRESEFIVFHSLQNEIKNKKLRHEKQNEIRVTILW